MQATPSAARFGGVEFASVVRYGVNGEVLADERARSPDRCRAARGGTWPDVQASSASDRLMNGMKMNGPPHGPSSSTWGHVYLFRADGGTLRWADKDDFDFT